MNPYLQNFLQIIPDSQRQKLLTALRFDQTILEYSPTVAEILSRLEYQKITEFKPQPEYVDSQIYNDLNASIYADLHILFNQAEILSILIHNNHILNMADLEEMRKELHRIKEKIFTLKEEVQMAEDTIIKIEDFTSTTRLEPYSEDSRHLYTDRDDTPIRELGMVHIKTGQGICKLPVLEETQDALYNASIRRLGNLSNTMVNPSHPVEHINDGLLNTLWGEFILAARPVITIPGKTVTETGETVTITGGRTELPGDRMSLCLCLDISGSMRSAESVMKAGARGIIDRLNPEDQAAVVTFGSDVRVPQIFTDKHSQIKQTISDIRITGATAMFEGMYKAIAVTSHEYGQPAVLVVTDGRNNRGGQTRTSVINFAKQHKIPIYIIGMGNVSSSDLEAIASQTGGTYRYVSSQSGLLDMYDLIAQDMGIGRYFEIDDITYQLPDMVYDLPDTFELDPKWQGVIGGARAAFEVILDEPKVLNSITLNPFGTKPMDVMNITIEEDINTDDTSIHRIVGLYASRKPFKINEEFTLDFEPVATRRITITLRQENYNVTTYKVRAAHVNKENLWDKVILQYQQQEWKTLEEYLVNPSLIQDVITEHTGWFEYVKEYEQQIVDWEEHEERARIAWKDYEQQLIEWHAEKAHYERERERWERDPYGYTPIPWEGM